MNTTTTKTAAEDENFLEEHKQSLFGKAGHLAQLFCIAFAFLVPSLLIWHVLLSD